MLRNWNIKDTDYLNTPTTCDFVSGDITDTRNITVTPDYVAPKELFKSSRDLGTNSTLNQLLNLTWEFPVDPDFTYLIRLHFCELDPRITQAGDRVFIIYLQGQMALEQADVMKWTINQKGVAVQRNYAISIPKSNNNKKVNLSLQMHGDSRHTIYSDPFLNGLEIFKISDNNLKNLAGPNPDPVQNPNNPSLVQKIKKSTSATTLISVVLGAVFGVVLVLIVVFFAVRRKWEMKGEKATTTKESSNTQNSSLPPALCRSFSLLEICTATKNFDVCLIIGVGGFGHVYKGYIDNDSTPVAIKRLKSGSQQGEKEFINEIDMLSKLRHRHLVSLIGYCNENNEMIIVYHFMARGTLQDHLYNMENPVLSWKQRLQISIGAARGLHYLHTGVKHTIIHRDVKATNILLDEIAASCLLDDGTMRPSMNDVTWTLEFALQLQESAELCEPQDVLLPVSLVSVVVGSGSDVGILLDFSK
ncbi:receptor protein kinase FERONIA [Trifolium repens]|nr:receptor protein kinase FERONIA [Trifolium repens]